MKKATCFLFALIVTVSVIAQRSTTNGHSFLPPVNSFIFSKPPGNYFIQPLSIQKMNLPANHIQYNLPKGAIFCRMEDALHQHFNLWIKVRMGDNDRYSN